MGRPARKMKDVQDAKAKLSREVVQDS